MCPCSMFGVVDNHEYELAGRESRLKIKPFGIAGSAPVKVA